METFFHHENQACPPSLSDAERLHLGAKSDLLVCAQSVAPSVTIDGAVVVQMLNQVLPRPFKNTVHSLSLDSFNMYHVSIWCGTATGVIH